MASVNKAILEDLYLHQKLSTTDIAKAIGVSPSRARTLLITNDIPLRSRADGVRAASHKLGSGLRGKKRVFSEEWKRNISLSKLRHGEKSAKGISEKPNGYLEITRGMHKGRGLHVVIAEKHIGRRIRPNEVVHHIDEDKKNNSTSNLQVMTRAEHARIHALENLKNRRRKQNGQFE